mgnify:CR=1 FL=1
MQIVIWLPGLVAADCGSEFYFYKWSSHCPFVYPFSHVCTLVNGVKAPYYGDSLKVQKCILEENAQMLLLCVNFSGLRGVQVAGKTLFLDASVMVFLGEISI